ncbi:MAG: TetR/AcrR family transcriptional regulator [Myxococcota bacterium]
MSRRGAATRGRLLLAARQELITRHGVLEVDRTAKRAGVSVGLIYRYYASKSGLVAAVMEDFHRRFSEQVMASNPFPGASWAERERERTGCAVEFHYHEPLAPVALSRLHLDPAVAVIEAQQLDAHIELASRNVAQGQRTGEIRRDLDPRFAAAMVLGGMRRVIAEALSRERRPPPQRVAAQLWRFVASVLGLDAGEAERPPRRRRRGRGPSAVRRD